MGRLAKIVATAALMSSAPAVLAETSTRERVRRVLAARFSSSHRVAPEELRLEPEARARIERRLGAPLDREGYTFFVARTGGRVDGYALVDRERSRFDWYHFAVFLYPRGAVTSVDVLRYPAPRGGEIRSRGFLRQFEGRSATSSFRPGGEVDMITGASISSRSLCRGVERAVLLAAELIARR